MGGLHTEIKHLSTLSLLNCPCLAFILNLEVEEKIPQTLKKLDVDPVDFA
jgi:hypothetical protein